MISSLDRYKGECGVTIPVPRTTTSYSGAISSMFAYEKGDRESQYSGEIQTDDWVGRK